MSGHFKLSSFYSRQTKWSFYGFSSTGSKVRTNNTQIIMKGNFTNFRQLVKKLEQIIPIISTQETQNDRSFYGFSTAGSDVKSTALILDLPAGKLPLIALTYMCPNILQSTKY